MEVACNQDTLDRRATAAISGECQRLPDSASTSARSTVKEELGLGCRVQAMAPWSSRGLVQGGPFATPGAPLTMSKPLYHFCGPGHFVRGCLWQAHKPSCSADALMLPSCPFVPAIPASHPHAAVLCRAGGMREGCTPVQFRAGKQSLDVGRGGCKLEGQVRTPWVRGWGVPLRYASHFRGRQWRQLSLSGDACVFIKHLL